MKEKYKIAIVDDDTLIRKLLSKFIDKNQSMEVVYMASNGETFLANFQDISFDILVLDLRMNNGNGLYVLQELKKTTIDISIIVLSTYYKPSFLGQMLKLGVNAFIPKDIEPEIFMEVIDTVATQGHYFSKEQLEVMRLQLSKKVPEFTPDSRNALTTRELEVLKLLCQQCTTKEIGGQLFISPKTVETHKTNLLLKTGVKNTAGLVIYAIQHKIVSTDELLLLG